MKYNKLSPQTLNLTNNKASAYRSLVFYTGLLCLVAIGGNQPLLLLALCLQPLCTNQPNHGVCSLSVSPQAATGSDFSLNGEPGWQLQRYCFLPSMVECVFISPLRPFYKRKVAVFKNQLSVQQWRQFSLYLRLMKT